MKLKVLLDMDGVIADFYKGFANYLNDNYNCNLDINSEPSSYLFKDWGHGVDFVDFDEASQRWIQEGGFVKLPIFNGASEFVKKLKDICNVFIVTARIGGWDQKFPLKIQEQIKHDTHMWLNNYDICVNDVFFTHNKVLFCKEYGIPIIIEDKMSTALEASKNGIHTIIVNREYNNNNKIDRFKIYRAFNFEDVLRQIQRMKMQWNSDTMC